MNKLPLFNDTIRSDPNFFIRKVFQEISPHDEFIPNWHFQKIQWELERCRRGEIKRLILTGPPRSGKTISTSVAFTALLLGHNPRTRIITASYSEELAKSFANDSRRVLESLWYRNAYPGTRIDRRKNTETEIRTTRGGGRFVTSIGSTLTGRGADFIIIDDTMNAIDAYSEAARNRASDWIKSSLLTRLNSKKYGVIILVAQRLHEDDPIGRLIEAGGWHLVNLPSIAIESERVQIGDNEFIDWKEGEALQPEREPLDVLDAERAKMGLTRFEAQYQQSPLPAGGNMVKVEWLNYYDPEFFSDRDKFELVVQSWDTASTVGETASYSVGTTWGVIGNKIYLLDVFRARCDFPTLLKTVKSQARKWLPNTVLVEHAASGIQLLQMLRHEEHIRTIAKRVKHDKEVRLDVQTPAFEAGQVLLPKDAPWLDEYRKELTGFPNTKYSDQVDSTTQALAYLNRFLMSRKSRNERPNPARPRSTRSRGATTRLRQVQQTGSGPRRRIVNLPFSDNY